MYLKRIEAQGFKSFANKTILEFNPGIMGIVGPNGSGKSNVVDAVRWVLGEQSAKQLRGSNMQDVIFAGTATRKPQGYAYVTLTIDNSDHALPMDFEEVIITRRVYRSGESEYLINGNACRLRDIHELFYDTGVGKEGYSIISQGQIDKILSTKPEDRRELFDEAAGIVKFKKRKDISMKKLEAEQNNLLRVTDILNELEKQVGPVKQQAETAREFLRLRDELKVYEVGAFYRESEELRKRLETAGEKLAVVKADFEQSNAAAEEMKAQYEAAATKREELDKQLEEDREELAAINIEKGSSEGRIKVLEEQVGTLKSAEAELKERLAVLDTKHATIAKDKEAYTTEKGELNDKLDQADDAVTSAQKAIEDQEDVIREKERQLELKQSGLLEEIKNQADISADSQGIAVRLEQAQTQKTIIASALEGIQESLVKCAADESTANDTLAAHRSNIKKMEKDLEAKADEIISLEEKKDKIDADLSQKLSEHQVSVSRLESLRNMAERYDGYGESIKHVMNAKKSNNAIKGVIADIITVDKKYEIAVETALGGKIQNVVTKDEATAKEMVEYLKKGKLGRVTFLPMDAVKGRELAEKDALSEPGVIDTANNLVTFDPQYKGIIDSLLGRTLVADTITRALAVAKKYKYRIHIVTLDGEYLAPGGSITGGAFKNTSNLLSRKREIEKLESDIETLKAQGLLLREEKEANDTKLSSARQAHSDMAIGLQDMKIREAELNASLETILAQKQRLSAEESEKHTEQEQLFVLIADLNAKVDDSEKAAAEALEGEAKRRKETEDMIAAIEGERAKLRELNEAFTQIKLDFSKLEERDSFLIENINRINEELDEIDDEKRELLMRSDPEGLKVLIKEREKDRLVAKVEEMTAQADELSARIEQASADRDGFAASQKELLSARDESVERAAKLDKDMLRLTNQQERISEAIEAQAKYLWDEYEMTPMEAEAQQYQGEESLSEMRKLISERKNAIKELGPVNVNAIEQEKEIGERYEFLSAQHEDLTKARDSILEVIKELEEGMRAQFEEKFAEIKDEFNIVFRDLFGGGQGTLELIPEEDGDILKSGVAIIAQPPGKKLQNMMQLSGGEKALTAIALIFAIQNLKPSPFCLLDEIEAALDESNVARFADYLEKLKNTTQLITITHRRGTMEAADKLYGITMQEKGISTIVSVNFDDAEKFTEDA